MNLEETLENASLLHAAVVHFPIVLVTFAVPMAVIALLFQRHPRVHLANALLFLMLLVSAVVAERTGEMAYAKVPENFDQVIWDQINEHEAAAALLKYFAAGGALMAALALIPLPAFRVGGSLMSVCVALAALFTSMVAAHMGGDLVYRYGVGTHMVEQYHALKAKVDAGQPSGATAVASAVAPAGEEAKEQFATLKPIDRAAAEKVSFINDVWPILEKRCLDCHDVDDPDGNYIVRTVEQLKAAGEKSGPGVIPGDPDNSSIVKYITGELQPRMPKRKPPLPEAELDTIRMWISAGAKDDTGAAAAQAEPAVPQPTESAPAPEPTPAPEPEPLVEAPAAAEPPAETPVVMEEAPAPQAPPALDAAPVVMEISPAPEPAAPAPAPGTPYDPFAQ